MKSRLTNQPLYTKTIVITGATSGVGRAASLAFAKEKATLVLAGRRTQILLELAEECQALGANVLSVTTDVTDRYAVKKLAAEAHKFSGKIDVWVNNAGVLAAGAFDETPIEIHDKVIQTNLMGYIFGAHSVLPYFKDQGYGILINNISVGAWMPTPYATGYTASKFGLLGFSEALKGELSAWKNIHVCDLFSAFLDTPGMQHAANYTGKVLRPAPPVYSAERVAFAMVKLAQHPKSSTTTDFAAPFLKLAYTAFPSLTLRITAKVMDNYFNSAHSISSTSGNVLSPVKYGSSISGGWQYLLQKKALNKPVKGAAFLTGLGIGLMLLSKLRMK